MLSQVKSQELFEFEQPHLIACLALFDLTTISSSSFAAIRQYGKLCPTTSLPSLDANCQGFVVNCQARPAGILYIIHDHKKMSNYTLVITS